LKRENLGKPSQKPKDEDLFVIDKKGTPKRKPQKKTFVERILENTSKTEPALCVEPKVQAKKSRKNDENKAKQRQKTLDLQKIAANQKKSVSQVRKEQKSLTNSYDLWGSKPEVTVTPKNFKPSEHAKQIDRRSWVKRPSQMKYKPDMAKKVEAVIPAAGGASYNPDFDAHQKLLIEEAEKAEEERKLKAKYIAKSKPPSNVDMVTAEDIVKEQMQGLGILPEDDEDYETEEELDGEEKNKYKAGPTTPANRKSKKQRQKERKVFLEQRRAKRRKKMRILMNQIHQVKKIKKDLRKFEDDLEKRREYRANKKEARMPRLGFLKYQKPDQELKLSSELKGSLRQLVPEGHVLTDRNDSFMARTMVEPRVRQARQKPKFRVKWQQKRTFREFEEKFNKEVEAEEKKIKSKE